MSRLFIRIWLSFWSVLAVTFAVALTIDYALALQRARNIDRLSPAALAASGAQAAGQGEAAARAWLLRQHMRWPELGGLVVTPEGRELSGLAPGDVARALAEPKGGPFPQAVDERVAGRTWRFVFHRIHRLDFDAWDVLLQPWVLAVLVLAVSGLGSAWLAGSLTRPLRRLQGHVRDIAAGRLETPVPLRLAARGDELGVLARDIGHMAERLRALLAAREAMLRDVSHELRAPLARLRASVDLARRRGAADASLGRMDKDIDRLDAMIGQILRFSRLEAQTGLAPAEVDLAELIAMAVEDARLEAAGADKHVTFQGAPPCPILADAELALSALENVLRNALRFSPPGGTVEVAVGVSGEAFEVVVRDRGPGVAEARLAEIFEPFHGEGSGAGLGLAITRRVMGLHGGRVAAANRAGGGLSVTLGFPRRPPAESLQSFALARHS